MLVLAEFDCNVNVASSVLFASDKRAKYCQKKYRFVYKYPLIFLLCRLFLAVLAVW
jgi:hypothetical protein